jgi:hypothetical protein
VDLLEWSGGKRIGWSETGEWLDYTVKVPTAGTFRAVLRVSSTLTGSTGRLRFSGGQQSELISVAPTGAWENFAEVATQPFSLPAGIQVMRFDYVQAGFDLDWIELRSMNSPPVASAGGPYQIKYGETLQLDGSGSVDPDPATEDTLNASWDLNNDWISDVSGLNPTIPFAALQLGVGTHSLHLTVIDSFGASSTATAMLTIEKAPQVLEFAPIGTRTYGDPPFTVTTTSSAGLPVQLTSLTPSVATVTGNMVTILGAGSATIRASQAGDANYLSATDVQQTFTVARATLTATGDSLSRLYNEPNPPLTGSVVGIVNGDNITPSYSTTATQESPAGVYTVFVTLNDPDQRLANYQASVAHGSLRIERAPQSISFGTLPPHAYGDAPFAIPVSSSSGLPVTITSSASSVARVSGITLTITGAGPTLLTAYQPGDGNYLPAEFVQASYTVSKGQPVLDWPSPGDINCQTVLGPDQLKATANIPGVFTYRPPAGSTLPLGDAHVLMANFAPADSANYDSLAVQRYINVRLDGGVAKVWEQWPLNSPHAFLRGLALDAEGKAAVSGVSFNGVNMDSFVARYRTGTGELVWQKRFNGPDNAYDEAMGVAVDAHGNVVVAAYSYNSSGNRDYYTAKHAAIDGALVWGQRYNGPANGDDHPFAIAIDQANNVLVTGYSHNGSNHDYYTAKYDAATGSLLWEKRYNGPSNAFDQAKVVKVDSSGDVIVSGTS